MAASGHLLLNFSQSKLGQQHLLLIPPMPLLYHRNLYFVLEISFYINTCSQILNIALSLLCNPSLIRPNTAKA